MSAYAMDNWNMWAFHIQPDGTPFSIVTKYSDQSIYFKIIGLTYFQLSIEYVGINYCFAISNMRKDM